MPQTLPTQPNMGGGLDPSVVALTKSIGEGESGGKYAAPSMDAGSPRSAYGFTPGFIKNYGPKFLGSNFNSENLTPEQQDKLAYGVVKDWGTNGDPDNPHLGKLTPAQIVSKWNTGSPNAYLDPDYGKNNAYGSTQKYVEYVSKLYDEKMGGAPKTTPSNPTPSTQPQENRGLLDELESVGMGALGWLTSHTGTAAKVGLPIAGAAIGSMLGPPGTVAGGIIGQAAGQGLANMVPDKTSEGNIQTPPSVSTPPGNQNQVSLNSALPESATAANAVKNAITEAMGTTQANRVFSQSKQGQDAINTASVYGLLSPDENGNLIFNEDRREELLGSLAKGEKAMIAAEGGEGSMEQVLTFAAKDIEENRTLTPNERKEALDRLGIEAQGYAPVNGSISLRDMVDARHQQYGATRGKYGMGKTSAQITAHKALAKGFRNTIAANVKNPELYNRLLKEESNLINAKHIGKRLHGKRAPKNNGVWESILRQSAKMAQIYIGDRLGGPIGAIVGGMAGDYFSHKLDRKFGRNIFETKGMRAAMDILHDTKPEIYDKLLESLEKEGINLKPKEIGAKKGQTLSGLVDTVTKDKKIDITEADALVNEIKDSKRAGLVPRKTRTKKKI